MLRCWLLKKPKFNLNNIIFYLLLSSIGFGYAFYSNLHLRFFFVGVCNTLVIAGLFYLINTIRFRVLKYFLLLIITLFIFFSFSHAVIYKNTFSFAEIASIFETNSNEAREFFQSFKSPILVYIFTILFVISFFISKYGDFKNSPKFILVFSLSLLLANGFRDKIIIKSFNDYFAGCFNRIEMTLKKIIVFDFVIGTGTYLKEAYYVKKSIENQWGKINYSGKNGIYIVVIGESASKSHMSVYGYSRLTTPYLEKMKGVTIIDGAISPAAITRESIPRFLTLNQENIPNYSLNIIHLLHNAGFKTYWISNQEFYGNYSNSTSKIANLAQNKMFVRDDNNNFDEILLPYLDKALQDTGTKKVIFLHLMGSHQIFQHRTPYRYFFSENESIDYYDSSIRYTDLLLKKITDKVKNYGGKIVYFSDHGLRPIKESPYLIHGPSFSLDKRPYEIPLVFIDTNSDKAPIIVKKDYYLRNFIHTLADWTGIENEKLNLKLSIINKQYQDLPSENFVYDIINNSKVSFDKPSR